MPDVDRAEMLRREALGVRCQRRVRRLRLGVAAPERVIATSSSERHMIGAAALRNGFYPIPERSALPASSIDDTLETVFAVEAGLSDPLGRPIIGYAFERTRLIVVCGDNILRWIGANYRIFPTRGGPIMVTAEVEGNGLTAGTIRDLGGLHDAFVERGGGATPRFITTTPNLGGPGTFTILRPAHRIR
ncbi:MAG: hypothetical protein EXS55_01125 [Candidatus Magasanikbacteria bacterium]|nr:hypothetical protein [Candidatus Magasanikbacteria bacterium]